MDVSINSLFLNSPMMNDGLVNRTRNSVDDSRFEQLLRRTMPSNEANTVGDTSAAVTDPYAEVQPQFSRFATIDKDSKLYEQCVELEIFLVKTLVNGMRSTIQKSGLIDEGFAGKMYEDMLYDEYARDFAINAKFGMADLAYLELTGQRGRIVRNNT